MLGNTRLTAEIRRSNEADRRFYVHDATVAQELLISRDQNLADKVDFRFSKETYVKCAGYR